MNAPGLQVVRLETGTTRLPRITAEPPVGSVAEGAKIPTVDATLDAVQLVSGKYAALIQASWEAVEDSALDLRVLAQNTLVRTTARSIDLDAFTGSGTAGRLKGIVSQGVSTPAAAIGSPTFDDISAAMARADAAGAALTVVWADPAVLHTLRTAKAQTAGVYLGGGPTLTPLGDVWGVPIVGTSALQGTGTVIVADGTRVRIGIREDLQVIFSGEYGFDADMLTWKVRARVAGVVLDAAAAVQVVTAKAS